MILKRGKMSEMKTKNRFRKTFALGGAVAMSAGLVSTVGMTQAQAYSGNEDPSTGIVWGVGQDGSYMVPLQSGGEQQGWCIDPGAAYPKQDGPYGSKLYGEPVEWGTSMSPEDKKRLGIALVLGKGIEGGQINNQTAQLINSINGGLDTARNAAQQAVNAAKNSPLPDDMKAPAIDRAEDALNQIPEGKFPSDINKIAAGVSGVIHEMGQKYSDDSETTKPPYVKQWSADRIKDGDARFVYDTIMNYSRFIPEQALPYVNFQIRESVDKGRQRMVLMSDIELNWEMSFDLNVPVTTPREDTGTSTTKTTKTSPMTTPSTTPSTSTEGTTSSSTTPREEKSKDKPEIRTSAGTKSENIVEQGKTITDTVTYKNLEKGETYRLTGETVDKETGEKDGNKGEIEFVAKTSNGRVDVPIELNNVASDQLVVFETLEVKDGEKWKEVATHEDVDDKAQTIGRLPRTPQIGTSAESSTGNSIQTGTTVNDTVRFQGLTPGKNYRLEARLMCKATGEDTGAVANHEFTPDQENGQTVVQNIQVTDPDCLEQVVFEKLYDDKGFLVAAHEDINDAAQTFGGEQPAKKKKKTPEVTKPEKTTPAPEAPMAVANADANAAPAPAPLGAVPAGMGGAGGAGGAGGGGAAPRQVIGSVPSGDYTNAGATIFTR